jgi:hypothetical protein
VNIQQTIISGIREQLFLHDYLVLPGFGGFVLKSTAAHFSHGAGALLPPAKTLSFNSQLKQNDGILASWLQQKLNCTAPEAMSHIDAFSEYCGSVLQARRRLSLPGIGFFYLDFENNTCFEPQADVNFLASSFGLGPVQLKQLEITEPVKRRSPQFTDRVSASPAPERNKPIRNLRKVMAPLSLIVLTCFLALLIIMVLPVTGELRASFFTTAENSSYTPVPCPPLELKPAVHSSASLVADASGIATLELAENLRLKVRLNETKSLAPANKKSRIKRKAGDGRFDIVLGCFGKHGNAQKLVRRLLADNISAEIIGMNARGLHVVSGGSFQEREAALTRLEELKRIIPEAWIKRAD